MNVNTGSRTVNPFPFISVLIFGWFLPSFCGIFFMDLVNLLLIVFVLKNTLKPLMILPFPAYSCNKASPCLQNLGYMLL